MSAPVQDLDEPQGHVEEATSLVVRAWLQETLDRAPEATSGQRTEIQNVIRRCFGVEGH